MTIPSIRHFIDLIISEGRDSPLYHSTRDDAAVEILRSGVIRRKHTDYGGVRAYAISTTRDPRLRYASLANGDGGQSGLGTIQFVLRQDSVARRFRISPFSWDGARLGTNDRVESEEQIHGDVPVTPDFVAAIRIEPSANVGLVAQIKNLATQRGIPVDDRRIVESASDPRRIYRMGYCDAMALALHRKTGLPLGLWAGFYPDEDGDEGDEGAEYAHACVVVTFEPPVWIDVDGLHRGVPDNLHFDNSITRVELVEASQGDVEAAFSVFDDHLQAASEQAEDFIAGDAELTATVQRYGDTKWRGTQ
jgi:hypothetical protein